MTTERERERQVGRERERERERERRQSKGHISPLVEKDTGLSVVRKISHKLFQVSPNGFGGHILRQIEV